MNANVVNIENPNPAIENICISYNGAEKHNVSNEKCPLKYEKKDIIKNKINPKILTSNKIQSYKIAIYAHRTRINAKTLPTNLSSKNFFASEK